MHLHELKWTEDPLRLPYVLIPLPNGTHIDIRLEENQKGYSIYLEPGHEVSHNGLSSIERWLLLDALTAQCVLHHLLQEHGVWAGYPASYFPPPPVRENKRDRSRDATA